MADPLRPGSEFGAYRIERQLGRGGMGSVYLAEDTGLKRKVALKVLASELAHDERFRERFVRESELAASLDEPNVLPVYEAGERNGVLFIAMRFVDGTDLRTILHEGPLSLERTTRVIEQVARALDAAHARGLVHRDVKPGNILIARPTTPGAAEHVYLADFGLTKRAASDSGITGTGVFVGTMDYAAPEQFEGRSLDARTDVYSLGCVLYECLTGSPPFVKDQPAALMYAHLNEEPPSASAHDPDLPGHVDRVIGTAIAKRPDRRYPSAGALAEDLRRAVDHPGRSKARAHAPRRTVVLALATVVIVVVASIAFIATGDDGAPGDATGPTPSEAGPALVAPGSLVRVDPVSGEPALIVPDVPGLVSAGPFRPTLAIGDGGVWLYSVDRNEPFLLDLDPATGEVRERTPTNAFLGGGSPDVAVGSRTVWYLGAGPSEIQRLNPLTYELLDPVSMGIGSVTSIDLSADALWAGSSEGSVEGFDPLTGEPTSRIDVDVSPDEVAVGQGSVWVMDRLNGQVVRVDPVEETVVDRIDVPGDLTELAAGDAGVWILDRSAGTITRVDGASGPSNPIRVGPTPASIAVGLGSIWVTDEDGHLYRVDPQLGNVDAIALGPPLGPVEVDAENDTVWVGTLEDPTQVG